MPQYDINSDDPLEMVWAIREKHYEETKNMSPKEKTEYYRKKADEFRKTREKVDSTKK